MKSKTTKANIEEITDKLFLPVDQLELVSKYIGAGAENGSVKLSKMGGTDWTKAKNRAKTADV